MGAAFNRLFQLRGGLQNQPSANLEIGAKHRLFVQVSGLALPANTAVSSAQLLVLPSSLSIGPNDALIIDPVNVTMTASGTISLAGGGAQLKATAVAPALNNGSMPSHQLLATGLGMASAFPLNLALEPIRPFIESRDFAAFMLFTAGRQPNPFPLTGWELEVDLLFNNATASPLTVSFEISASLQKVSGIEPS